MTPEAKVKKVVVNQLRNLGAYYFYPVTGGYGRSGVPDIVGCYRGRFFGIECKAGRNTPTPLQQINLDDIEKQKGIALIVNEKNMHSVQDIFNPTDVNDKQMEFDFDYK
jgi:Holliday junction resolvase